MPKLPEHIDQLDSFYQKQFENFTPKVSPTLWDAISKTINQPTGLSVSNSYLAKIAGILLGSLALLSILTLPTNETTTTTAKETTAPIINETNSKESENYTISSEANTNSVILEQEDTIVTTSSSSKGESQENKTLLPHNEDIPTPSPESESANAETTEAAGFQFVEELE